jgi:hypothetical protein
MSEMPVERRRMPRYPLSVAVETEQGKGVTRDVSASGIYFETAELYTAGAPIRFTLVFEHSNPAPLRLSCAGEVRRVDANGASFGVAATINAQSIKAHSIEPSSP